MVESQYEEMKSDKIVIYFGNVLYPDLDAASHRTIGNAKALRKLGYRVILIGTRKGETRSFFETKESFSGFDIYYFPDPQTPKQWKEYLFYYRPLKTIVESFPQIEAVILYNHPSISTRNIISYCHKHNIKVYADCTEWFDPQGISVHNLIKRLDTWYRMKVVNAKLDGVIAISSFLQGFYIKKGCKTICVPPLIDMTDSKWAKEELDDYIPSDETVKLCYVGNPGAGVKDKLNYILTSLKRTLEKNPSVKCQLSIVGMTAQQYYEVFQDDATIYTFAIFMGRKPNMEALAVVKRSDFSIFLRERNLVCTAGFPTKFSESIACGTPVLTNLSSDLDKYLIDGKNGFIMDISSKDSLDSSLAKALQTSREELKRMKEYCCNEKTFDYHSYVGEFSKMF